MFRTAALMILLASFAIAFDVPLDLGQALVLKSDTATRSTYTRTRSTAAGL